MNPPPISSGIESSDGSRDSPRLHAIGSDFEAFYRANIRAVERYFARRSTDPNVVADLTSETFVRAITSAASFSGKGTQQAWVFAIARVVYARHQAELINGRDAVARLSNRVVHYDQLEEIVAQVDAERDGRALLERCAQLPELERSAIELVDLAGLSPTEAAHALGVSTGTLRVRLFRARTRLRKDEKHDNQI